jgi:hypothetical protein
MSAKCRENASAAGKFNSQVTCCCAAYFGHSAFKRLLAAAFDIFEPVLNFSRKTLPAASSRKRGSNFNF